MLHFILITQLNVKSMPKYSFYRIASPVEPFSEGLVLGVPHNRPKTYQKLPLETKRLLVTFRKRRGDVTAVAARTGYSVPYVSQVLNNQYQNTRILNVAYDRARNRRGWEWLKKD
jgi:hypothetical protein